MYHKNEEEIKTSNRTLWLVGKWLNMVASSSCINRVWAGLKSVLVQRLWWYLKAYLLDTMANLCVNMPVCTQNVPVYTQMSTELIQVVVSVFELSSGKAFQSLLLSPEKQGLTMAS